MYNYNYSTMPLEQIEETNALFAAFGAFFGIIFAITFVILTIQIIAMWKIFSKAGEKGWKSLIPIYNAVILFKICGISPWLILVYLSVFIPFIGFIATLVLSVYQCNKLAKSFGKDIGYTIGLIFLNPIFIMILAFSNAEYVGSWYSTNKVIETDETNE